MFAVVGLYLCRCVLLCVVHLQVPVDELTLAETDYLHAEQSSNQRAVLASGFV